MIVVRHPHGYEAERRYVFDVVLGEFLGLEFELAAEDRSDVAITSSEDPDGARLIFADVLFATPADAWLTPTSLPVEPLAELTVADAAEPLPVLYGTPTVGGHDLFGSIFFMLTRYEEIVSETRDAHERFPSTASLARRAGFLERPVVNEYVDLLWSLLVRTWPRLERRPRRFRLRLSHDVDFPLYRAPYHEARSLVRRDLAWEHAPLVAARRLVNAAVPQLVPKRLDLCNTFGFIMDASERLGLESAFYFIAGNRAGAIDGFYTLDDPWIRRLLASIDRRGHEIGFHASYTTFRDPEQTRLEVETLREAAAAAGVARPVAGGRQHYLRWENPVTWQNWEDASLDYDSTLAFGDHVGFRSGTCYEHPVFNLRTRKPLRLRERPLVVMEASLLEYQQLGLDAVPGAVARLADRVRRHDGDLTLLWHNDRLLSRRARRSYLRTIAS